MGICASKKDNKVHPHEIVYKPFLFDTKIVPE